MPLVDEEFHFHPTAAAWPKGISPFLEKGLELYGSIEISQV